MWFSLYEAVRLAPSSPLEGEPNRPCDLVGGKQTSRLSPHQNREERFWLPRKGGATARVGRSFFNRRTESASCV